ncbi:unnamed protein product [Caenorhabditis angaria]|uniref:C-type lectin domain-containing protein n=1 Tax=Caenorhabditis angaria TaxID=860376 RepID=A0A9P1IU86_9PELO|nr:unnamed protein product [Caenorhabditis angaria]
MSYIFLVTLIGIQKLSESCIPTQQIDVTTTTPTTTTTTTPLYECVDSTWTKFDRGTYFWCMKIFIEGILAQEAVMYCAMLNSAAVPSGFQNSGEVTTMMNVARGTTGGTNARLTIGAYRRAACEGVIGVDASCTQLNSFYWTDGYTSGTTQHVKQQSTHKFLISGSPDNSGGASIPQMYMIVDSTDDKMDDAYGGDYYEGAVCGMLAMAV